MHLSKKIKAIESDRTNGASQIGRNALGVLRSFVYTSKHKIYRSFMDDFLDIGRRLFEARLNMLLSKIWWHKSSMKSTL